MTSWGSSSLSSIAFLCRSFKTELVLKNWTSNLFLLSSHRPFNTGMRRGISSPGLKRIASDPLACVFFRVLVACAI